MYVTICVDNMYVTICVNLIRSPLVSSWAPDLIYMYMYIA